MKPIIFGLFSRKWKVSSKAGNCLVGDKRKDLGPVFGHGGETSSKRKIPLTRKK